MKIFEVFVLPGCRSTIGTSRADSLTVTAPGWPTAIDRPRPMDINYVERERTPAVEVMDETRRGSGLVGQLLYRAGFRRPATTSPASTAWVGSLTSFAEHSIGPKGWLAYCHPASSVRTQAMVSPSD